MKRLQDTNGYDVLYFLSVVAASLCLVASFLGGERILEGLLAGVLALATRRYE